MNASGRAARTTGWSLASILSWRIGILFALILSAVALMAYWSAKAQIDEVNDSLLVTGANVLRALMQDELNEMQEDKSVTIEADDALLSAEDLDAYNKYADWRAFRVWQNGKLAMKSDTGPDIAAPPGGTAFRNRRASNGQEWRFFYLSDKARGIVIGVGEDTGVRQQVIIQVALELIVPFVILAPASAALIWLALQSGLLDLHRLIAEIREKSATELNPLAVGTFPADIVPLVATINQLFERLQGALVRERRLTDLAAHQLRTPLAALKLQAQMAERCVTDPAGKEAVAKITTGADRAAALVEQLLALARLQDNDPAAAQIVDLSSAAREALDAISSMADVKGLSLALTAPSHATSRIAPAAIALIFSNLLENAVKFAPPDSEIDFIIEKGESTWNICVKDTGHGISEADSGQVFDRFFRGATLTPGAGLGLTIVREAAEGAGGAVRLRAWPPSPGLWVEVSLPFAPV